MDLALCNSNRCKFMWNRTIITLVHQFFFSKKYLNSRTLFVNKFLINNEQLKSFKDYGNNFDKICKDQNNWKNVS